MKTTRTKLVDQTAESILAIALGLYGQAAGLSAGELADLEHEADERLTHKDASQRLAGCMIKDVCKAVREA
jgi:hypothetical protein